MVTMKTFPQRLLGRILTGERVSPEDLDKLIEDDEGQFHDFKSGAIVGSNAQRKRVGAPTIREYAAAFANADGGFLAIGIEDKPRAIKGCTEKAGHRNIAEWAQDALGELGHYLQPPPRTQLVHHPKGHVLMVATAAAPSLVPVESPPRYYRRQGDSNLQMSESLVADIRFGRKQHPSFQVSISHINARASSLPTCAGVRFFQLKPFIRIDNVGLIHSSAVLVGLLSYTLEEVSTDIPESLLEYVEHVQPNEYRGLGWNLNYSRCSGYVEVAPLHSGVPNCGRMMTVPYDGGTATVALLVMSLGSPPIWHQLSFDAKVVDNCIVQDSITVKPTLGQRPVIGFAPP